MELEEKVLSVSLEAGGMVDEILITGSFVFLEFSFTATFNTEVVDR